MPCVRGCHVRDIDRMSLPMRASCPTTSISGAASVSLPLREGDPFSIELHAAPRSPSRASSGARRPARKRCCAGRLPRRFLLPTVALRGGRPALRRRVLGRLPGVPFGLRRQLHCVVQLDRFVTSARGSRGRDPRAPCAAWRRGGACARASSARWGRSPPAATDRGTATPGSYREREGFSSLKSTYRCTPHVISR